jgi:Xaa-Pro aminopeptidase
MKSDLDLLMQARRLDALLVLGNAEHNPPMYYFLGGGHVGGAALIKKRGEEPILFCQSMEREEAARSGLKVLTREYKPVDDLAKDTIKDLFIQANITQGRVGLYGQTNASAVVALVSNLASLLPGLTLVGEPNDDNIFLHAMETKSEDEVARIRKMGRITIEVVGLVAEYLTGCEVGADEVLLEGDGKPLTVGDMQSRIRLWLAERDAELPDGFIFSVGRDAGVPHSTGNPEDLIRLGQTIIFDIYPAETGGGYFYDFTRTWSLGYATPEAQKLYDEVHSIYRKVVENLDMNAIFKGYQKMVCDEFYRNGHQTPMHTPGVPENGYVHSLGHGLGLNIHERPWSRHTSSDDNLLKPGVTFTIEPGLYYPDKGMGARIEDSYWMRPDGTVERLADYPYDFVLKMKKR